MRRHVDPKILDEINRAFEEQFIYVQPSIRGDYIEWAANNNLRSTLALVFEGMGWTVLDVIKNDEILAFDSERVNLISFPRPKSNRPISLTDRMRISAAGRGKYATIYPSDFVTLLLEGHINAWEQFPGFKRLRDSVENRLPKGRLTEDQRKYLVVKLENEWTFDLEEFFNEIINNGVLNGGSPVPRYIEGVYQEILASYRELDTREELRPDEAETVDFVPPPATSTRLKVLEYLKSSGYIFEAENIGGDYVEVKLRKGRKVIFIYMRSQKNVEESVEERVAQQILKAVDQNRSYVEPEALGALAVYYSGENQAAGTLTRLFKAAEWVVDDRGSLTVVYNRDLNLAFEYPSSNISRRPFSQKERQAIELAFIGGSRSKGGTAIGAQSLATLLRDHITSWEEFRSLIGDQYMGSNDLRGKIPAGVRQKGINYLEARAIGLRDTVDIYSGVTDAMVRALVF